MAVIIATFLQAAVLISLVNSQPNQLYKDGDIIIGAVLSVHEANTTRRADFDLINACGDLIPSRVLLVSQFRRTIAAINSNPNLLPGVKLGYNIIDACSLSTVATVRAMQWATTKVTSTMMRTSSGLQPKPVSVVIGTELSRISAPLNMLLQQFKIPQIDFGATSADLSDRRRYRLYSRTSSSDVYQARAMASLAYSLGWQCVHIVYSQGHYGEYGLADLKTSLAKLGICTASEAQAPITYGDYQSGDYDRIVANIEKTPSAAAIICFCETTTLHGLMISLQKSRDVALNLGEFRPRFVIVAGDAWGTSTEIPDGLTDVAAGAITLRLAAPEVADFNDWFASQTPFQPDADPWFLEFWEEKFKCTFRADHAGSRSRCKLDPSIRLKPNDLPSADSLGLLTTAIYAAAHGLQEFLSKACSAVGEERCTPERMLALTQRGARLHPLIANVSFELPKDFNNVGQWFQFDENGEGPAKYDYHVYRRLENGATPFGYVKIGEWSSQSPTASLFQEAKSLITWPDTNALVTSVCACRSDPLTSDSPGCGGRKHDVHPATAAGVSRHSSRTRGSTRRTIEIISTPRHETGKTVSSSSESSKETLSYLEPEFVDQTTTPLTERRSRKTQTESDTTFLIMDSSKASPTVVATETPPRQPSYFTQEVADESAFSSLSSAEATIARDTDGLLQQPNWLPTGYLAVGLHCKGATLSEYKGGSLQNLEECVSECDLQKDCYGITVSASGKPPCYPKSADCKFLDANDADNQKWAFIVKVSNKNRATSETTTTTTLRPPTKSTITYRVLTSSSTAMPALDSFVTTTTEEPATQQTTTTNYVRTTTTTSAAATRPANSKAVNAAISLLAVAPQANLSSSFTAIFRQKVMTVLIRLPGYIDTHKHCRGGAINLEPVLDLVACQQLCDVAGDSCAGITISLRDSKTCFAKSPSCTLTSGRSESWTFLRKEKVNSTASSSGASSFPPPSVATTEATAATSEIPLPTTAHLLLPVRMSSPLASLPIKISDEQNREEDNSGPPPLIQHHSNTAVVNDVAEDFASIFKFEDSHHNRHPPSPSPSSLASLIANRGNANSVVNSGAWQLTTKAVPIPALPSDIQRTWFGSSDFLDIHQHCKGGSLENALVYFSVDRCKAACRNEPTCVGISISLGGSGFCFLKNASCQLSGASDDWTFLRRQS